MKFIIQAGSEALESNAGLVLAGKILAGLDLDRLTNGIPIDKMLEPRIKNADVDWNAVRHSWIVPEKGQKRVDLFGGGGSLFKNVKKMKKMWI